MGELRLEKVTIRFGARTVVQDFSLVVRDGEMVALLGPSGAGKTTILKTIAGLLNPAAGDIRIDGQSVKGIAPEKRDAVMVFQAPLLFPFMNVAQNIGFGLRMRGRRGADAASHVRRILSLTRLAGLENRKVHELSGGQQQRVALARALVLKPSVLLLDEPLSNLDATLRQRMRNLILEIQAETRMTMLFVTHDQSEALMMSDRVALLLDGRMRQVGQPRELFRQPADPEVARFFGGTNFFQGRVSDGQLHSDFGIFPVGPWTGNGGLRTATIRPEDIHIAPPDSSPDGTLTGRVVKTSFEGSTTRIVVACPAGELTVLTSGDGFTPGQAVHLALPADRIRIFPPDADRFISNERAYRADEDI
jgi:ABC-type Fe3+/spermidine/putrescine transport system ATPase subunit